MLILQFNVKITWISSDTNRRVEYLESSIPNRTMTSCNHLFLPLCETFLLCPKAGNVSWILHITHFIAMRELLELLDNRLFVCVKITVLPQSDVYLVSSACSDHIELCSFILMSGFVFFLFYFFAAPAYFLSNDTPQWKSICAVFPINTRAYFRAVVCTARLPLAPQSVSSTCIKLALCIV